MSSHPAVERAARELDDSIAEIYSQASELAQDDSDAANAYIDGKFAAIIERETHYTELVEAFLKETECRTCLGTGLFQFECQSCLCGEGSCTCASQPQEECPECEGKKFALFDSKHDSLRAKLEVKP